MPINNPFADPEHPIDYNIRGKDVKEAKVEKREPAPSSSVFSLEDFAEKYRVYGVPFKNDTYVIDIAKELLLGGAKYNHDGWLAYSKKAAKDKVFALVSAPMYHALFTALYRNKDVAQHKGLMEKVRTFLHDTFDRNVVYTLSSVTYYAHIGPPDHVAHNLPTERLIENIIGPDEWLKTSKHGRKACKAILGTDNLEEINDVYHWISGYDTYLWRLDKTPQETTELAVIMGEAGIGQFRIKATADMTYLGPAIGIRAQKISRGKK